MKEINLILVDLLGTFTNEIKTNKDKECEA